MILSDQSGLRILRVHENSMAPAETVGDPSWEFNAHCTVHGQWVGGAFAFLSFGTACQIKNSHATLRNRK